MKNINKQIGVLCLCGVLMLFAACKSKQATNDISSLTPVGPAFVADSAFAFCEAQCEFGPRTMNSEAHDRCAQWIVKKFQQYGCQTTLQEATLTGYDGTQLRATNIIASYRPAASDSTTAGEKILLCAHWDSRPWADNDPDSTNWHKPVMAANDGASGVAVMLEIARLLQQADSLKLGVDFICFDAEDWGTPRRCRAIPGRWALSTGRSNMPPRFPIQLKVLPVIASASCSTWWAVREPVSIRSVSLSSMPRRL